MWILSYLPNFLVHIIFSLGLLGVIVGFIIEFLPLINRFKLPIQIAGITLLTLGVYLEGGIADAAKWELKAKELELKVAEAEAKSQKENVKIVEKVVKKTEYYRLRGNDVIQYVDREVTKYDSQCVIPKEFIKAHNDAAEKQK